MDISRRSFIAAGAACASGLAGAQASQPSAPEVMRCSASYGEATYHTVCLRGFCEELKRETRGAVDVQVTAEQKLKKMDQVLGALKTGELQLGEVLMSSYAKEHPVLSMDTVPFIVRGWSDARKMWASSRPMVSELLSKQGVLLLYAVPWPPQGLYSTTPVTKLADLEGKKFRVFNEATKRLAELVKAVPVEVSGKQLTEAIADGRVEAMVTSSTTGVDSHAWTTLKHFSDMKAWMPKNMVVMSELAWRKMNRDQRAALDRASANAEVAGWAMAQKADLASQDVLRSNGVKIEVPGVFLRREMDLRGERFGAEWAGKSTANLTALVQYYKTLSA